MNGLPELLCWGLGRDISLLGMEGDREAAREDAWRAAWKGEEWREEEEGREGRRPEEDLQASSQLATPPAGGKRVMT